MGDMVSRDDVVTRDDGKSGEGDVDPSPKPPPPHLLKWWVAIFLIVL
jgi:hypothetical protein